MNIRVVSGIHGQKSYVEKMIREMGNFDQTVLLGNGIGNGTRDEDVQCLNMLRELERHDERFLYIRGYREFALIDTVSLEHKGESYSDIHPELKNPDIIDYLRRTGELHHEPCLFLYSCADNYANSSLEKEFFGFERRREDPEMQALYAAFIGSIRSPSIEIKNGENVEHTGGKQILRPNYTYLISPGSAATERTYAVVNTLSHVVEIRTFN